MTGIPMTHPGWVAIGLAMVLIGIWLIRWANRNSMTGAIADATAEAAIGALKKRGRPDMPADIRARLDDVAGAPTATGKARKVARYAFRHAMSQVFGIAGFIMVMAGLLLAVFGAFYA
ncbi:MAG: hypothetical protein IKE66_11875 [Hyphomicrobium sp.]|nr:hypothetical protein [Hyphomicrobium sp.]